MRGNVVELVKVVRAFPAVAIAAGAVEGADIFTRDAEDLLIALDVSNMGGTSPTVNAKLQQADNVVNEDGENEPGDYADVASGAAPEITGSTDNGLKLIRVNCGRYKPWLRLHVTFGGTSPTGQCGALALLGRNSETPVEQPGTLVLDLT